jgi:hypothetical protein
MAQPLLVDAGAALGDITWCWIRDNHVVSLTAPLPRGNRQPHALHGH